MAVRKIFSVSIPAVAKLPGFDLLPEICKDIFLQTIV
jgi:hypothetical protein